mgnify:CR=1 FL=1
MATTISISIPDNKVVEFLVGFLRSQPIPVDENGNPTMATDAWVKNIVKQKLLFEYSQGKRLLQQDSVNLTDINIT